jgi:hypothetical protein
LLPTNLTDGHLAVSHLSTILSSLMLVGYVVLQIGLSREAHRTLFAPVYPLVRVLAQMTPKRLLSKGLFAQRTIDFCWWRAISRFDVVQNFMK